MNLFYEKKAVKQAHVNPDKGIMPTKRRVDERMTTRKMLHGMGRAVVARENGE